MFVIGDAAGAEDRSLAPRHRLQPSFEFFGGGEFVCLYLVYVVPCTALSRPSFHVARDPSAFTLLDLTISK